MGEALAVARAEGITHLVFGDLFLADVRAYREAKLAGTGIAPVFPLWGRDTGRLAREMLEAGLQATLTCVDPRKLDRSLAGRAFDAALLGALPPGVDPCGENGEFHSFVSAGPMFSGAVPVVPGEVVEREGFVFADLAAA
jgi:diphthamide synthase (EF-2-diphthine--ammonia ligase)